jgi:hypothetical protein
MCKSCIWLQAVRLYMYQGITCVTVVPLPGSCSSSCLPSWGVPASAVVRKAVPTCTAAAPAAQDDKSRSKPQQNCCVSDTNATHHNAVVLGTAQQSEASCYVRVQKKGVQCTVTTRQSLAHAQHCTATTKAASSVLISA